MRLTESKLSQLYAWVLIFLIGLLCGVTLMSLRHIGDSEERYALRQEKAALKTQIAELSARLAEHEMGVSDKK